MTRRPSELALDHFEFIADLHRLGGASERELEDARRVVFWRDRKPEVKRPPLEELARNRALRRREEIDWARSMRPWND